MSGTRTIPAAVVADSFLPDQTPLNRGAFSLGCTRTRTWYSGISDRPKRGHIESSAGAPKATSGVGDGVQHELHSTDGLYDYLGNPVAVQDLNGRFPDVAHNDTPLFPIIRINGTGAVHDNQPLLECSA